MAMPTRMQADCISCILRRFLGKVPETASETEKRAYTKAVLRILADADWQESAPEVIARITEYKNQMFGFRDDYAEVKRYFNAWMLEREELFAAHIAASADPLQTAVKFSLLGNYIDFGALEHVDEAELSAIPQKADALVLDALEYARFLQELSQARSLILLTDNCGEIVMDKLLLRELRHAYPQLELTVIVKGGPVLNDATREDAEAVALGEVAAVFDNGCSVAGTVLSQISAEAKNKLEKADVILAKGQANFETLCGCGCNVYYLFLCKCKMFSERFGVPVMTGMFCNDRRLPF